MDTDSDRVAERLVFVIRATNIVESKMKRAITMYLGIPPKRSKFTTTQLLNNAVVPFGAKVKLVLAIAADLSVKIDREALHTMLSRRNGFAHQDHLESVRVVEGIEGHPEVAFVVESLKGSGTLEVVSQDKAMTEFMAAYLAAETDLNVLLQALAAE